MGRDIPKSEFSAEDKREFDQRLREETRLLMDLFKSDAFENTKEHCGFELEMCLVDKNCRPSPKNEEFLARSPSHLVVPELSRFNFEINSTPHPFEGKLLSNLEEELIEVWRGCRRRANQMGLEVLAIGILPTITDENLTMENMSSLKRYLALNHQILKLRKDKPLELKIDGKDILRISHHDVMLESVTTSLQIHLQVNSSEAVRYYNTAQILSAPIVAVAANSPYLFGKDLWEETRIPVFEQAISVASFRDSHGEIVRRVTFGTGYGRNSLLEPFLENLDRYPVLLPMVLEGEPTSLSHLRLHNGTIWRWNRPLIGLGENGKPHIRIEHRVASAGPSISDIIANIAFFLGLINYFLKNDTPLETLVPFEIARHNFYRAAKKGFAAKVTWVDGKEVTLQSLLLGSLLPAAREGLLKAGLLKEDVSFYIDDIMANRIRTGKNGAGWQRSFIGVHGNDFQAMTRSYIENQKKNIPVHEWPI